VDEKERICKNIKEMDEKEMQRVSDSDSHDDNASIRSKQRMHGLIRACRRHLRSLPSWARQVKPMPIIFPGARTSCAVSS
jgi:GTP1/Obg family GTP-binding protein